MLNECTACCYVQDQKQAQLLAAGLDGLRARAEEQANAPPPANFITRTRCMVHLLKHNRPVSDMRSLMELLASALMN